MDSDRKPMESVLNGEINYLLIQKIILDAVQRINWGKIENKGLSVRKLNCNRPDKRVW